MKEEGLVSLVADKTLGHSRDNRDSPLHIVLHSLKGTLGNQCLPVNKVCRRVLVKRRCQYYLKFDVSRDLRDLVASSVITETPNRHQSTSSPLTPQCRTINTMRLSNALAPI